MRVADGGFFVSAILVDDLLNMSKSREDEEYKKGLCIRKVVGGLSDVACLRQAWPCQFGLHHGPTTNKTADSSSTTFVFLSLVWHLL
jgi:hypothetical protein